MSHSEIGGYLALSATIFVVCVILRVVIVYIYNAARKAYDYRKQAKNGVPWIEGFVSHLSPKSWQSAQEQRQAKEESYWFVTKCATVGGAIGAVVAALFAFGAFHEAGRQADAADQSNRAWLHVERVDASKVSIFDNSVSASIDILTKNIGHSVATDIRIAAEISLPEHLNFVRTRKFCDEAESSEIDQAGKTAFPDSITLVSGAVETFHNKFRGSIPIVIISCVLYRWAGESSLHKTGVVFILKDVDTASPGIFKNVKAVEDYDAGGYAD